MHHINVASIGGPEVLAWAEAGDPAPGPGEVLVGVEVAGLNFIDTYQRSGLYPMELPFTPGLEGCGAILAVGADVEGLAIGQRVAWTGVLGSYAELLAVPADEAVVVPEALPSDTAGAVMLQGITAHYLVNDTYPLQEFERCLIHAGAGGVGRLLIQMAKAKGAEVFATAGGEEKTALAREAGANHVIDYTTEGFKDAIEALAGPRPLHVVYDGVGAATFDDGLDLLRPRGTMVAFGNASGLVPPVDPRRLMTGGSLYLTRPTMGDYLAGPEELRGRTADLFSAMENGSLDVLIGSRFPLAEAGDAHRALEARATVGKVLLDV
jgi:NADPH2:quinone reductase